MKILLAADGSPHTANAARHLVNHLEWFGKLPEIHVVHVQPPMPYPRAAAAVGKAAVHSWQREESETALAVAEKELGKAGISFVSSWRVGDVAPEISAYVKAHGIDLVVMGSHGKGSLAGLVLGSVATQCIATLEVPVMIVGRAASAGPVAKRAAKAKR